MPIPESRPLPALALSAFRMAEQRHQELLNQLAAQTYEAVGLPNTWNIDLTTGMMTAPLSNGTPPLALVPTE